MYFLLTLLFDATVVAVTGIINGYNVSIESVPYQVNYGDVCGGVLIDSRWVLTTAHCGSQLEFIRIGNKRRLHGAKIKVLKHIVHPKYGIQHEFDYDLQLLHIRSLRYRSTIRSVVINDGAYNDDILVSGWGYHKEKGDYTDELNQVILPLVPFDTCNKIDLQWYNQTLTDRMFCAGGGIEDACQGDSGGPAVSYGKLVGISSFGFGCGRRSPGVYMNVSEPTIRHWIKQHVNKI